MTAIVIFTSPNPFAERHINIIQRNAIRSWMALVGAVPGVHVKVVLLGEEDGLKEAAEDFELKLFPDVQRSEWGTPCVSSLFESARQYGLCIENFDHRQQYKRPDLLQAYVNADIILILDFLRAAQILSETYENFLMVGQCWDLDVTAILNFGSGWGDALVDRIHAEGQLHSAAGSDYFVFSSHLYVEKPGLAVGRAGWDNWMIYHARHHGWHVIDVTQDVIAVHQNHDYRHLENDDPNDNCRPYDHEEVWRNVATMSAWEGGTFPIYTIMEIDRELVKGNVRRKPS